MASFAHVEARSKQVYGGCHKHPFHFELPMGRRAYRILAFQRAPRSAVFAIVAWTSNDAQSAAVGVGLSRPEMAHLSAEGTVKARGAFRFDGPAVELDGVDALRRHHPRRRDLVVILRA